MKRTRLLTTVAATIVAVGTANAKERHYQLTIAEQELNFTGESVPAMTINGGIPGPTLEFSNGDTAVIEVRNDMDMPTSVHWHGLLVPPEMDGVPGISFPAIQPHTTFTYRIPIRQTGTYWYHSHSGFQEQVGVYGSIVIKPNEGGHGAKREKVVLLSDWTNRSPKKVTKLLRRGSEVMSIERGTAQSMLGAVKTGKLGEFWKREAMRMPAMDLADVAYDAFLTNGKKEDTMFARAGEKVRLRIIDGSASTFFHLQYAGGPLRIVAADGIAVQPLTMKKPLLMGVAEVYDVIVTVPSSGAYEFRATAHDGSGHTSLWIGSGERHAAPEMPKPFVYDTMDMFSWKNMFALTPAGTMGMPDREVDAGKFDQPGMNMEGMNHGGMSMPMKGHGMHQMAAMKGMGHGAMNHDDMSKPMKGHSMHGMKMGDSGLKENPPKWYDFLLRDDAARAPLLASDEMMSAHRPFPPYKKLRATRNTSLPAEAPRRTVRLTLDGDMNKYVWMLNNRPVSRETDIHIKQGEVVRFVMINRTMMHHPMHLHGHFFRVINGQGERSPLKHTVDVEPMNTTVIEFEANEVGDWFFHCHLLYHMMSGMARVVEYDEFTPDSATQEARDEIYHDPYFFYGSVDLLSNETQGSVMFSNILNTFAMNYELGWDGVAKNEWETDITYERYINRFTSVFGGVYAEGVDTVRETERLIAGFHYLLPLNFGSKVWVDSDGGARVTLERELMLTPRLGIFGEMEYDTHEDWSYQAGASYLINEYVSATALWDSKYGVGAGVTLRF